LPGIYRDSWRIDTRYGSIKDNKHTKGLLASYYFS